MHLGVGRGKCVEWGGGEGWVNVETIKNYYHNSQRCKNSAFSSTFSAKNKNVFHILAKISRKPIFVLTLEVTSLSVDTGQLPRTRIFGDIL